MLGNDEIFEQERIRLLVNIDLGDRVKWFKTYHRTI